MEEAVNNGCRSPVIKIFIRVAGCGVSRDRIDEIPGRINGSHVRKIIFRKINAALVQGYQLKASANGNDQYSGEKKHNRQNGPSRPDVFPKRNKALNEPPEEKAEHCEERQKKKQD